MYSPYTLILATLPSLIALLSLINTGKLRWKRWVASLLATLIDQINSLRLFRLWQWLFCLAWQFVSKLPRVQGMTGVIIRWQCGIRTQVSKIVRRERYHCTTSWAHCCWPGIMVSSILKVSAVLWKREGEEGGPRSPILPTRWPTHPTGTLQTDYIRPDWMYQSSMDRLGS